MRLYIAQQQQPNQAIRTAMEELEQGKGMRFASAGVGAGHARDEKATSLQSLCKCRGRGPLLRSVDALNLMAVTLCVGTLSGN